VPTRVPSRSEKYGPQRPVKKSEPGTFLVNFKGRTNDIVVDGIVFTWHGLVYEVMRCAIDAENQILLERPGGDVTHKLFISGFLAAAARENRDFG
jgi:hypothetical protein